MVRKMKGGERVKENRRNGGRVIFRLWAAVGFALVLALATPAVRAQEQETGGRYKVINYSIDATLLPSTHTLTARVKISFVPQTDMTAVNFKLDSGLKVRSVLGPDGQPVQFTQQGLALAVSLLNPLPAGKPATLTTQYAGLLETADGSPVEGLKLAYVGPEGSYLLYPACWFPVNGAGLNRFSATLHITVPQGQAVIASGEASGPVSSAGADTYTFQYDRQSFPGTVIAGPYVAQSSMAGGVKLTVYLKQSDVKYASPYGATADKVLAFYADKFGALPIDHLDLVEMDNDTLGGFSAPGVVALAARGFTEPVDVDLLAHEIAHQWWRCLVSPATPDDGFLDEGLATYSSAMFIQDTEGETAFEDRMQSVAIDALTHESVAPIAQAGTLQPFSPEYQSVVFDKGAMVFHMLRWVIKDPAFFATLKAMARDYAWKSITTAEFQKLAEDSGKQRLTYFFAQWVDSTGVPQFKRQWAIYKTQTGYQVVGKMQQDLDIFRMPIDVRVYAAGRPPVNQVVEMVGTTANFTIDTRGRPLEVMIDPASDILKFTEKTRVQVEMARADQLAQETEYFAAIGQYRKVLQENPNNSLAHYRIGDILFTLRNYNAALESFQDALNGDLNPKWVEVWSYLKIGQIFDASGQRDRALNEYQRALHTNDNTQGALTLANEYIKKPYATKITQAGA
ncbi:MAG: M1 family aminopeptidase [Terriglobia bacterium]